jgi:hypothetical protein
MNLSRLKELEDEGERQQMMASSAKLSDKTSNTEADDFEFFYGFTTFQVSWKRLVFRVKVNSLSSPFNLAFSLC